MRHSTAVPESEAHITSASLNKKENRRSISYSGQQGQWIRAPSSAPRLAYSFIQLIKEPVTPVLRFHKKKQTRRTLSECEILYKNVP